MATFYLIRHGLTDAPPNILCGRMPGVHLTPEGRIQAQRLAERFRGFSLSALYCSPLERTIETATPLAELLDVPIQVIEDISEIDYGDWTARDFAELESDPQWHVYNMHRTGAHIPGGEHVLQLQNRFVAFMERARLKDPNGHIALVSHQDPIKTAVAHFFGLHLDMFARFEISHASVTIITIEDMSARFLTLNNVGTLPM